MKDKAILIVAVGFALSLVIPQISGCIVTENERQISMHKQQEAANLQHWNGYVKPAQELCIKKGGWPTLADIPGTGNWEWQVHCAFPSTPPNNQQSSSSPEDVARWIHHEKSAEAARARDLLRSMGWKCC